MINPLSGLLKTVGPEVVHAIQTSKVLVVGSGGIGCELIKSLALLGFRHVEVIDLDTIDVSNLNRQLLFRTQHVGQPKCTVACQVAVERLLAVPPTEESAFSSSFSGAVSSSQQQSNLPPIHYLAHHGNICDANQFTVAFVKQFTLVLNALDNVEARRRVNRLCLAANVPLMEAGTTGYLGQVTVIHKSSSVACYECKTQETQTVYPICTIRSTPSMPVHTIVWAKELYKLIFHPKVEESMLYEDMTGAEPSTYMATVMQMRRLLSKAVPPTKDSIMDTLNPLIVALYCTEINKQLDMGRYKAAKKTPTPLDAQIIVDGLESLMEEDFPPSGIAGSTSTNSIWEPTQCITELANCFMEAMESPQALLPEFDKDDDLAMRFVTATSNLRSFVFGIEPLQSLYSAKGIAGNIIPAIATTNAICAGIQMLQVIRLFQTMVETGKQPANDGFDIRDCCVYVNCLRNPTRNGLYLTASSLEGPNPSCFVCRHATLTVALDLPKWTLAQFLQVIVKQRLGFEQPTILLQGDFIWEEGDGVDASDYQGNLRKLLADLPCGGITHGSMVDIEDFSQDLTVQLSITQRDNWTEEDGDQPFAVLGQIPKGAASADATTADVQVSTKPSDSKLEEDDDDDDVVLVIDEKADDDTEEKKPAAKRRPETEVTNGRPPAKKRKVHLPETEVIEID